MLIVHQIRNLSSYQNLYLNLSSKCAEHDFFFKYFHIWSQRMTQYMIVIKKLKETFYYFYQMFDSQYVGFVPVNQYTQGMILSLQA